MEESQSFGLALLYHVLPSSLLTSYVLPTRHSVSSNLFHISIGPRSIWDPPNQPRWRVFQLFLSWIKLSSRHLYIFVHTFLNTSQEVAKIRKRKWKDVKATKCDKRCSFDTNPPCYSPNLPGSGISWPHLAHQGVWPMKARHQARKRYLTCERKMSRGNHVEPWTCSAWRKQHGDRIKIDRNNQILTRRIYKWNSKHSRSF
jgi:hypothetical protein